MVLPDLTSSTQGLGDQPDWKTKQCIELGLTLVLVLTIDNFALYFRYTRRYPTYICENCKLELLVNYITIGCAQLQYWKLSLGGVYSKALFYWFIHWRHDFAIKTNTFVIWFDAWRRVGNLFCIELKIPCNIKETLIDSKCTIRQ